MCDLKEIRINNIIYGGSIKQEINEDGLGKYIFDLMKRNRNKVFQINAVTQEQRTYGFFNQQCVRVALEMKARGVQKEDVVLLISRNIMNAFVPVQATFYLNAIIASLDPSVPSRDVAQLIKIIKPKIVFTVSESLTAIQTILEKLSMNIDVVVMESELIEGNKLKLTDFLVPKEKENDFIPDVVDNSKRTALILFSSGTTGFPKPIKCSHYGLLYTITGEMMCGYDCGVIMQYNSFHWISAYLVTMFAIISGGKIVIPDEFKPEKALEYFDKYKVTTAILPTTYMYQFTKENTLNYRNIFPKYLIYGGSGMNSDSARRIISYFPNIKITFTYGLSEVSGFVMNNLRNYELFKTKFGSVGTPNPGLNVKIVDFDTEEILPPNKKGEIRLFTKAFFNGYCNEDTKEYYDKDGFLKTGDIGYYDEDNCLYVTDRIKEMFKYQGWPINPNSLESILYNHPAVQEAVVVGIAHETDGHHPMGIVILKEKVTSLDIKNFYNERVSDREKLRAGLLIVKILPKTPSGKIMRNKIVDLIVSGKHHLLQQNNSYLLLK